MTPWASLLRLLWLASSVAGASGPIACPDTPLVAREEVVLPLVDTLGEPIDGATVRVVWRPGLASERRAGVGITDSQGRVRWTPDDSGPARLVVDKVGACRVHVAWPAPPLRLAVPPFVLLACALALITLGGRRREASP